ncbi:MAG: hypothetical protein FWD57_09745, partial [Polyangiaceae bacterium]|nr:hypothetical protein [Polyangiaceae bacterium]
MERRLAARASRPDRLLNADARMGLLIERGLASAAMELGDDLDAAHALNRAGEWLSHYAGPDFVEQQRNLVNDRAYLLATARDPRVRHPERS